MEYRLRNKMSHKIELPTAVKIVIAGRSSVTNKAIADRKLISALAAEAIATQSQFDRVETVAVNIAEEVY